MSKNTIDLKALLESKMGSFEPTEDVKSTIEAAEKKVPHNLMFDAESTVFKPETRPTTMSGAKQKTVEDAVLFNNEMDRFIQEALVPGVDFGIIPGCNKPCLLKSGAEKIALYLNLIFRIEVVGRTEDFQQGFFAYECKCYVIDVDGIIRGEGLSAANSKEPRYAKQSGFAVQNTILKMCKKRALVDCILNVGALSSRFTQDLEDMDVALDVGKSVGKLKAKTDRPATKKQLDFLRKLMQQHGNTEESMNRYVKQAYGLDNYEDVSGIQCSELIEKYKALDEKQIELSTWFFENCVQSLLGRVPGFT